MTNTEKYNICVCGGGNISHAISGNFAYKGHKISILTRQPNKWNNIIEVVAPETEYKGVISKISDDPKDVIPNSDIIIISVPIYAIKNILDNIKPYITPKMILIGIPGRLYSVFTEDLDNDQIYLLRTPYICRIIEYGKKVHITGYVYKNINYWSNNFDKAKTIINNIFYFESTILRNIESINMVNSNTILHPARLYALFSKKEEYNEIPYFYRDWCLKSSEILIDCDNELINFISLLNKDSINKIYVKSILQHYECKNSLDLTTKISNIESFINIKIIMKNKNGFYYPDYSHRYFIEDIMYGMKYLIDKAKKYDIILPKTTEIYNYFYKKISEST